MFTFKISNSLKAKMKKFGFTYLFRYAWHRLRGFQFDPVEVKGWMNDAIFNDNFTTCKNFPRLRRHTDKDLMIMEIARWIYQNIRSVPDVASDGITPIEDWQTPRETLERMMGDCEDQHILMIALGAAYGIPPTSIRITPGRLRQVNGKSGGHLWVEYRSEREPTMGLWYTMETAYGYYYTTHMFDSRLPIEHDSRYFGRWWSEGITYGEL